jgi:hypothetical protein
MRVVQGSIGLPGLTDTEELEVTGAIGPWA